MNYAVAVNSALCVLSAVAVWRLIALHSEVRRYRYEAAASSGPPPPAHVRSLSLFVVNITGLTENVLDMSVDSQSSALSSAITSDNYIIVRSNVYQIKDTSVNDDKISIAIVKFEDDFPLHLSSYSDGKGSENKKKEYVAVF